MIRAAFGFWILFALVQAGCSAAGSTLDVGSVGVGGRSSGSGGAGGATLVGALDAGASKALSVRVEESDMRVEIITLGCSGECADVVAVASGGYPPYSYAWEDGSTQPARRVCPTASTEYAVSATDSGTSTPEFRRPPRTVRAPLTAKVQNCPTDGGAPPRDSGTPPPTGQLCVSNPSFEGTPGVGEVVGLQGDAWFNCNVSGSPDYWDEKQSSNAQPPGGPRASDGATYIALFCNGPDCTLFGLPAQDSLGQAACAPLVAGTRYSFQIDLSYRPEGSIGTAGGLEVWGGTARCGNDELLWTSPPVTSDWKTYCGSFVAKRDLAFLQVKTAKGYPGTTGVFVDHLVPVASCAP